MELKDRDELITLKVEMGSLTKSFDDFKKETTANFSNIKGSIDILVKLSQDMKSDHQVRQLQMDAFKTELKDLETKINTLRRYRWIAPTISAIISPIVVYLIVYAITH